MPTIRMTPEQAAEFEAEARRRGGKVSGRADAVVHIGRTPKYRNQRTELLGKTFASKKEAQRYLQLLAMQHAGQISGLELQPVYLIEIGGELICRYIGDFRYIEDGQTFVEDVKSSATKTPVYRLKKKLLYALYGIEIREV